MIYFTTDSKNRVEYTHFRPFDEKYGLGKTAEELSISGHLVESLPQYEGEIPAGKYPVLCYDTDFYWEFEDIVLEPLPHGDSDESIQ